MSRYSSLFTEEKIAEQEAVESPPVVKYRLLFVDDEPNVLSALRRGFRQENYIVETAASGQEALDKLALDEYQLVVSDYQMPGMNGGDLLRTIKEHYPETIRIMLTGHADTNAVMGAIKDGAVYRFILKPWNDDDLRVTVALALEQHDLLKKNRKLQEQNKQQTKQIKTLAKLAVTNRSQLAIMLSKRGHLNERQVQELHRLQENKKQPLIRLLLERQWVDERTIRKILREELMVEEVSLAEFDISPAVVDLVPRSFCEKQWVLPLKLSGRRLMLALADPMDEGLLADLRFVSGLEIQPVMANMADIKEKIAEVYGDGSDVVSFEELETVVASIDPYDAIEIVLDEDEDDTLEELLKGTEEPPAIRLVNAIILEAMRLDVSDIHIQPRTKNVVVRYRIDGVLSDKIKVPLNLLNSLVARIKVMAELDITERRRPQDGRVTVKSPMRIVDIRISTLPTINGEKIVMRILDRNAAVQGISELGLSSGNHVMVEAMVSKPQGLILATGPTGSGKTTTLYSILQHVATPEKNYVTIEDPVEFYFDMAGQVLVRERIGLDFATILRAILRQDPDVILLGEIRDLETAEVAFHAALTGHQVFSTLHTNSAVATIARLFDLGLKPYIVASALQGIIAQRLVRRVCEHCKQEVGPDQELLRKLGEGFSSAEITYYRGSGCSRCHGTGYHGRLAIHEVLLPDEQVREAIASGASVTEINKQVSRLGVIPLRNDALQKVSASMTTVEEILRVLGPQLD